MNLPNFQEPDRNLIAFDPRVFEQKVQEASQPAPAIRHQLMAVINRHAPGVQVEVGERDGYDWRTKVLTVSRETARGVGMRSLVVAAHECGHAQQHLEFPWLPWWALKFPVIRGWLETDAWRRVPSMLS